MILILLIINKNKQPNKILLFNKIRKKKRNNKKVNGEHYLVVE